MRRGTLWRQRASRRIRSTSVFAVCGPEYVCCIQAYGLQPLAPMTVPSTRVRFSVREPAPDLGEVAWTIVLAGDDDAPLSSGPGDPPGAPRASGRASDIRSVLEASLDRLAQLTPPSRIMTVIGPRHLELLDQLRGRTDHVLCQPASRDTGFGLYIALAMIRRWAPRAVVTIVPIGTRLPVARAGLAHLTVARRLATLLGDQVVVLGGAVPTPAGPPVAGLAHAGRARGTGVHLPHGAGWQLEHDGAPWAIASACASVDATWELGRVTCPKLIDILDSLVPLVGTPDEDDAIDYIYRAFRSVNFAHDMIARAPWRCVTVPLEGSPGRWESVLEPGRGANARRPGDGLRVRPGS